MKWLHMEGHFVGLTKMHVVTCGSQPENVTKRCASYMWNVTKFEFENCQTLIHTLVWCCGSGLEE